MIDVPQQQIKYHPQGCHVRSSRLWLHNQNYILYNHTFYDNEQFPPVYQLYSMQKPYSSILLSHYLPRFMKEIPIFLLLLDLTKTPFFLRLWLLKLMIDPPSTNSILKASASTANLFSPQVIFFSRSLYNPSRTKWITRLAQ